jgi:multiple sugar transport system permease protein
VRRPVSKRRPARRRARHYGTVSLFMLPAVIGFAVFIAYPMIASLYYSFTNYDLLEDPTWVGFQNYRFMFTKDPMFWQAMRNTLWIIAVGVPLQIVTSLSLAWLLTRPKRGSRYYRTFLFLPTMVPPVAAALGFVFLFNPATGPINQGLQTIGVDNPPLWFFSAFWSKWGLVFLGLWGVGQTMMIFLAGLLDVPRQLYEAAEIEGAGPWQRFRYITLPMISPVMFFSVVIGVIAGFQYFTQAYIASFAVSGQPTGGAASNIGGPEESTLFYSLHLYIKGFAHFQMGYASAMAWILFLIIMVCTIVIIRTSRRWVHYQGGFR